MCVAWEAHLLMLVLPLFWLFTTLLLRKQSTPVSDIVRIQPRNRQSFIRRMQPPIS